VVTMIVISSNIASCVVVDRYIYHCKAIEMPLARYSESGKDSLEQFNGTYHSLLLSVVSKLSMSS